MTINKVFDTSWFQYWQKPLLWLSNTQYGRSVLGIDGKRSSIGENKLLAILPHAIFWRQDNKVTAEFRTHNKFAKRLFNEYKYLWRAIHGWDTLFANNFNPRLNLGFDTLTVYPDPNPEITSVDGQVRRQTVDETLATIRAGAGNNSTDSGTAEVPAYLAASTTTNQFQRLVRGIFLFDTSALGGGTVTAATFSLYGETTVLGSTKVAGLGSPDLHLAGSTPASNTALVNADYGQVQTTTFGNITYANWSALTQYNDITVNAAGQSNISVTGVSKFSTQTSWDINNSFTGAWVSGEVSSFSCEMADQTGTTKDPKLVVTYTPAPAVGLPIMFP